MKTLALKKDYFSEPIEEGRTINDVVRNIHLNESLSQSERQELIEKITENLDNINDLLASEMTEITADYVMLNENYSIWIFPN